MFVQFSEIDLFAIKLACSQKHPAKSSGSNHPIHVIERLKGL